MNNTSKTALIHLVSTLKRMGFEFLDCQVYTAHMESMGARHIPRSQFIDLLERGLQHDTHRGNWKFMSEFS
jgi:leucyl/phenylalanyl-tRNA--protein transferase